MREDAPKRGETAQRWLESAPTGGETAQRGETPLKEDEKPLKDREKAPSIETLAKRASI